MWMNGVGCIDIGVHLFIRRSDANREIVGAAEIVEKIVNLLLESDDGFVHSHSKKRSGDFDTRSNESRERISMIGEVMSCSGRWGLFTFPVAVSLSRS